MSYVTLKSMLQARENRAQAQDALLNEYALPVVSFTLNIPGPQKNNQEISAAFHAGLALLRDRLQIVHERISDLNTGCEALLLARGEAEAIKRECVAIEEADALGRLFDIDVLDEQGRKISREAVGAQGRRCLLCEKPAHECARSRAHSADELFACAMNIMRKARLGRKADQIAELTQRALLVEVASSPKPGLVDRFDRGAHEDMDIFTFLAVIPALGPFFRTCARLGQEKSLSSARETFPALIEQGKRAERTMYAASKGVNTHKGAIFSLGLLCAACGRLTALDKRVTAKGALSVCQAICRDSVSAFFKHLEDIPARTVGERLYKAHGLRGVRGEAAAGFPTVQRTGLPMLRRALEAGCSLNDASCITLLHIMAEAPDTVLIGRASYEAWQTLLEELAAMLRRNPFPTSEELAALNQLFIARRLSPGGSADLLSVTLFLYFAQQDGL